MNKKCPLIDLIQTEKHLFWVYNNLAYLYDDYKNSPESDNILYIRGNIGRPKTEFFFINESSKTGLTFIDDDFFTWIFENYYNQRWNYSEFVIDCFSSYQYRIEYTDDLDEALKTNGILCDILIFDFEEKGLYPNPQKLDLVVKNYLSDIVPDWGIQYSSKDYTVMDKNRIYHFFEYHFKSYKGNCYDFINHCNKIINEVWEVESPQNLKRQKYFDEWKTEKLVEYGLDPSKLKLETMIKPKSQMNIRLYEDFSYLKNCLTIQFKLPYKFISADINQMIDIVKKYYNDFFYTHSQVLVMNEAFASKGFFVKGTLPYEVHNTPKYFLQEFYVTLEEREKINRTNEINEDDLIRVILKERLFIEISDNQDLTDEYLQSVLLVEFDKKREFFFEELNKLALEFLPQKVINTPETLHVTNNLENKKLTLTGSKVTIYHVFKQLIAKQIIGENAKEVAEFLIRNVTGFENSDIGNLATEITRDRKPNLEKGSAGISRNNRIDLD